MTPWGNAIAYENEAVRQYITDAPLFWLTEYQLDGLRFDAIDQIEDRSARHVLIEIAENIRAAIPDRHIHLTTEDSRNVIFLHPRDENGHTPLFTAEWNDDFHNAAHVFATGETHAYYQDFAHQPAKNVARALAEGFVYQGEVSPQTGQPRGVSCAVQPPQFFVDFIQNHDQTGNRAHGERLISLAGAEKTRVLLAALLLSPHIPLLFMGEEYGETHPFLFFTDFQGALAKAVREGRAKSLPDTQGMMPPFRIRTILKPLSALSSTGRRRQARRGNPGCALPATLSYCAIAISSRCSRQGAPWKAGSCTRRRMRWR